MLKWAYQVDKENNTNESEYHKKYYDRKFHCMSLYPGDLVLVRVKAFSGNCKIVDKWDQTPHCVLSQLGNQAVFNILEVGAKDEEGILVLHGNMLFSLQSSQSETNVNDTDGNKQGQA